MAYDQEGEKSCVQDDRTTHVIPEQPCGRSNAGIAQTGKRHSI